MQTELTLPPQLATLSALAPLKTWSVIVTYLGDLDQRGQGGAQSGKEIGARLGAVGLRAEAIRVALHRLRKDGWIVSRKAGREVHYALSERARAETSRAAGDVYEGRGPAPWHWLVCLDGGATPARGVQLSRELWLTPLADAVPEALTLTPGRLPPWVAERLMPAHLVALAEGVRQCAAAPLAPQTDPSAHRLLLLHHWRKLALREETWAHIHLFPQGPLAQCHAQVRPHLVPA